VAVRGIIAGSGAVVAVESLVSVLRRWCVFGWCAGFRRAAGTCMEIDVAESPLTVERWVVDVECGCPSESVGALLSGVSVRSWWCSKCCAGSKRAVDARGVADVVGGAWAVRRLWRVVICGCWTFAVVIVVAAPSGW
jgi:hypothetical protein